MYCLFAHLTRTTLPARPIHSDYRSRRFIYQPKIARLIPLSLFVSLAMPIAQTAAITDRSSQGRQQITAPGNTVPTDDAKANLLEPGKLIEREIKRGEIHSYQVMPTAGQFVRVKITAREEANIIVVLLGPDGDKLVQVDHQHTTQGERSVSAIAESTGWHRLEVRPAMEDAAGGRYKLKLEELRAVTPLDKKRMAAEVGYREAEQLFEQKTAASRCRAIEEYETALALWQAIGDRSEESRALHKIGTVYDDFGEKQQALGYYQQALALRRALGDRRREAITLNHIGTVYFELGEKQRALDNYSQALSLRRAVADGQGEVRTLNSIAYVYKSLGEKQKALAYYHQALTVSRTAGDRIGEARTLHNMGKAHDYFGEKQTAINYYNQALLLTRSLGNYPWEANTLHNIGVAYDELGEKQKALDYFNQALVLWRRIRDGRGESYTLHNIGSVYQSIADRQKALDYYGQAIRLSRAVGDRSWEAATLNRLGTMYLEMGDERQALGYYQQALEHQRALGDLDGEASTLRLIAHAHRGRGRLSEARSQIEAALAVRESVRTKIMSQQLRASYFATVQKDYEFYIDLLMQLHKERRGEGFDALALQASERARARSLLELLNEARVDIRQGIEPSLLERQRTLQQRLNAKAAARVNALGAGVPAAEAAATAREIEALTTEYYEVEAQIRRSSPRYAALTQPQPLSLKEIRQQLDVDTMLLEYSLGEERSYLWAVTPTTLDSYELPKRAQIEAAVRRIYSFLNARQIEPGQIALPKRERLAEAEMQYRKEAILLSEMLLRPVASQLETKRLLIIGDGILQYLPFAALPVPSIADSLHQKAREQRSATKSALIDHLLLFTPLVTQHEILNLPSASVLAALRQEKTQPAPAVKAVAVLADPVFDKNDERVRLATGKGKQPKPTPADPRRSVAAAAARATRQVRLTEAEDGGIPRLPFSRWEAEWILSVVPVEEGMKALDFQASRAIATGAELRGYRIIHFATHGLVDNEHPELSGVILSLVDERGNPQDGFLRLHEIYNLKLPAELVVLSACQTALGKEIRGEGLVGLVRGFMYAGAPRVVASLWKVDDRATAELMKHFYQGMLVKKLSPAAALRAAQAELWRQKRWRDPRYWAAFTMQGEWQ